MNPHPLPLNRRNFLKSTAAGVLLAATPTTGLTQGGAPAAKHPARQSVDGLPEIPIAEGRTFRANMSLCVPKERLSRNFENGRWQLIDYETVEGVQGAMVSAYPEYDCGELTLPLEAQGPHKIFLGINYTKAKYSDNTSYGQLDVKLDRDPGFRRVGLEVGTNLANGDQKIGVNNFNHKSIQEVYWKTAELSGQSLVFRQVRPPYDGSIANLSYVKLVPLNADEQSSWQESQPTESTRRMGMIFCTGQFTGHLSGTPTFHPTDPAFFQDEITPYLNSDINILMFEAMRGNYCLFKTKLGDVGNEQNQWQPEWVDPLAEMTRLAHGNGLKIFATLRMIGTQYPMNREPVARARNYWKNPEWAKRDRNGVPLATLSVAFPGVRAHWLGLLREALAYGVDGIQLHLNRSTPFVHYEEPVVNTFIAKHGEDPRKLPEDDPRWVVHCAEFMTDYIREVRALLDEQPGRELGVTIYGEPHKYDPVKTGYDPIRYNCDVDTWIREGLVNYVLPSPYIDPALLKRWRAIGGPHVHLWPDLMPRTQLPENYARLAKRYYEAGADGLGLWDGERRAQRLSEWAAVQRLGHRDQLDQLAAEATTFYRRVPLKYLDGFSVKDSFHDG
ncbi:MAG: family 10 glycosylhydrolase [Cephaloticoccus sp.]|nr:family 10 glycosylhydrolase [Cephaloticoccus sp.]